VWSEGVRGPHWGTARWEKSTRAAGVSSGGTGQGSHISRPRAGLIWVAGVVTSGLTLDLGLLDPAVGAGLVAAGLVSVLIFSAAALSVLPRPAPVPV